MNKYKKLIQNSVIMTIGSLGSKVISFFLLPLYTYSMSTSEYGISDIVQTLVTLLSPVLFLSIFDAVLRFASEKDEAGIVFTDSLNFMFVISAVTLLLAIPFGVLHVSYVFVTAVIVILQSFQTFLSQFLKAVGKVRVFAINGIFMSILMAGNSVLFLTHLKMGLTGFFLVQIISLLISNGYLLIFGHCVHYYLHGKKYGHIIRRLLKFSMPLIPNSVAWWATNAINRLFVIFFLGSSFNGIFAVANKIPTILSTFTGIFSQSWQLSAIDQYQDKDKTQFYSNIFNLYLTFLLIGASIIIVFSEVLTHILASPAYESAVNYIAPLVLTVVYSSLSSFLGANLTAAYQTGLIFSTTIIGSILNVVLGVVMIPFMGLYGASYSGMISFLCIWLIRHFRTPRNERMQVNWIKFVLVHLLFVCQIVCQLVIHGTIYYLVELACFILILLIYSAQISEIILNITRRYWHIGRHSKRY